MTIFKRSGTSIAIALALAGATVMPSGTSAHDEYFATITETAETDLQKLKRLGALLAEETAKANFCVTLVEKIIAKSAVEEDYDRCEASKYKINGDLKKALNLTSVRFNDVGKTLQKIYALDDGHLHEPEIADTTTLRITAVKAGDLNGAHCEGHLPVSNFLLACYGEKKEEMVKGEKVQSIVMSPGKKTSCGTGNLSVEQICGSNPAPQGKNQIHIHYRCGDDLTSLDATVDAGQSINLHCDNGDKTAVDRD